MLVYLAVPYSHEDPAIRQQRFERVSRVAARLMMEGHLIFSPISHTHQMCIEHEMPTDWEFWQKHCLAFVSASSRMIVLKLDGWELSVGVRAEMEFASRMGIRIEFMEWSV
jgi:hypothetical protein